jgi:hypothetical protein
MKAGTKRAVAGVIILALCSGPLSIGYAGLRRGTEREVPVISYWDTNSPLVLGVTVAVHPDDEIARASVIETATTIEVRVRARPQSPWSLGRSAGTGETEPREFGLRLRQPLADRTVLDGRTGEAVRRV